MSYFTGSTSPFNAIDEFKAQYRCITADLRNALGGQPTGRGNPTPTTSSV